MSKEGYVALLRGVNVGGRAKVSMQELRALFESAGLTEVESYVQSGNIVFRSPKTDVTKLERTIEQKISKDLGIDTTVVIRSAADLRKIIKGNPLIGRTDDPTKLHVTFLPAAPDAERVAKLPHGSDGSDELSVSGREIYLFCPGGYGTSKLSNTLIEKRLATRATTRNWRTVLKLVEMTA